jgi:hypothetical protein
MLSKEDLGDKLCDFCPLEKKNAYSVPGGFAAGCEGSKCDEAYENYQSDLLDCFCKCKTEAQFRDCMNLKCIRFIQNV